MFFVCGSMSQITLGDVGTWIAAIAALMASCAVIYMYIQKALKKLFEAQTKELQSRLDKQEDAIKQVDVENCKNFLVSFIGRLDRDDPIDEIEKERFWEQYEHYTGLGANGYIRNRVESLQKRGVL